jgi:hypothetical protein
LWRNKPTFDTGLTDSTSTVISRHRWRESVTNANTREKTSEQITKLWEKWINHRQQPWPAIVGAAFIWTP